MTFRLRSEACLAPKPTLKAEGRKLTAEHETAEDAMRRACDAILQGDVMTAMADLSPEALNEAMTMGANIMALPTPVSYAIESHETVDDEERYVVRFKTSAQDIIARASWRQIDGAWKIVSISAEGL